MSGWRRGLGFPGEYSSVQRWIKRWREMHRRESDGYAELECAPDTAQVDYAARAVIAGAERTVHYLAVSFPYPDHAVRGRLARGDHRSACDNGLSMVFAHAGMAPRVLVSGRRGSDGTVTQTSLFSLFCARYGFETRCPRPVFGS